MESYGVSMNAKERIERPSLQETREEIVRLQKRKQSKKTLKNIFITLLGIAAIAVLAATLWLPILQVYGNSMEPTLKEGDIVLLVKGKEPANGDIIGFYYNNKILIKRVIAQEGQYVDIKDDGTVFVDGKEEKEYYIAEKSIGECNITFPYQVPDGRYFVLGDERATSVDSRSSKVGDISEEQVIGTLIFRVWPLSKFNQL